MLGLVDVDERSGTAPILNMDTPEVQKSSARGLPINTPLRICVELSPCVSILLKSESVKDIMKSI